MVRKTGITSRDKAIRLAKQAVENTYGSLKDRPWLIGTSPHSYQDERYRVETHVVQGTPPKGFIIASDRFDYGVVLALSGDLMPIAEFRWKSAEASEFKKRV